MKLVHELTLDTTLLVLCSLLSFPILLPPVAAIVRVLLLVLVTSLARRDDYVALLLAPLQDHFAVCYDDVSSLFARLHLRDDRWNERLKQNQQKKTHHNQSDELGIALAHRGWTNLRFLLHCVQALVT